MALTNDQITAQNFKDFYNHIMPYLNGQPALNYSTEEQVVGTWIDGKPLYQKTIDCGALPNASQKIVSTGIQNAETLVWAFGCTTNDNNTTKMVLPRIRKDNKDILIGYDANLLSITIDTESDRSSTNAYVVLQYTKTTD